MVHLDVVPCVRRQVAVKNPAVIRNFRTIVLPAGTRSDAWETQLSEVESDIAPSPTASDRNLSPVHPRAGDRYECRPNVHLDATTAVWVQLGILVLICWFICAKIEPAIRAVMMRAVAYFGQLPDRLPASKRPRFSRGLGLRPAVPAKLIATAR